MTHPIDTLLTRKAEIEDWFKWHPNSSDEPMMRDEYKRVNESIDQYSEDSKRQRVIDAINRINSSTNKR